MNGYVYWITYSANGNVSKLPVTGGTPTIVADKQSDAQGLSADESGLYWGAAGILRLGTDGVVKPFVDGEFSTGSAAFDDKAIYWLSDGKILKYLKR